MPNNGKIGKAFSQKHIALSEQSIGKMEETIARAYTRSAHLRAILLKSGCPEVIQHSKVFFDKLLDPQVRGSLVTDIHTLYRLKKRGSTTLKTLMNRPLVPFPLKFAMQ